MGHPEADWQQPAARAGVSDDVFITPNTLIVVARREFARGCLACWITNYCRGLAVFPVASVESDLPSDVFVRCIAALIGIDPSDQYRWLYRQIAWLRARQPRFPVMLIPEYDQCKAAADLAVRLDLQGYIPASSSLEVAAAAVQLVIAGGSYFPRPPIGESQQHEPLPYHEHSVVDLTRIAELTSRERAVLVLLSSGLPNKVIAKRLSMSLSTVKAHVHHIIRKLKVGNRTEVALRAQSLVTDTESSVVSPIDLSTASLDGFHDEKGTGAKCTW
jgi:DNA-binding NarL/FixJ family response regulator